MHCTICFSSFSKVRRHMGVFILPLTDGEGPIFVKCYKPALGTLISFCSIARNGLFEHIIHSSTEWISWKISSIVEWTYCNSHGGEEVKFGSFEGREKCGPSDMPVIFSTHVDLFIKTAYPYFVIDTYVYCILLQVYVIKIWSLICEFVLDPDVLMSVAVVWSVVLTSHLQHAKRHGGARPLL